MGFQGTPIPHVVDITYLFIDGAYLTSIYKKYIMDVFGNRHQINIDAVRAAFNPRKTFYYDSIDTVQRKAETAADHKVRMQLQRQYFDDIRTLNGVHVTEGRVKKVRDRRVQKEVDVALAVDMLNHAVRSNMTRAVLIAGDSDFRPLVQSLVQFGTYVVLASDPTTTAMSLAHQADEHRIITSWDLVTWTSYNEGEDRSMYFPTGAGGLAGAVEPYAASHNITLYQQGTCTLRKKTCNIWFGSSTSKGSCFIVEHAPQNYTGWWFNDKAKLEQFITQTYGLITWTKTL